MPPGSRALAALSKWFDPTTVTTVFEPLVADWQREWHGAPSRQRWRITMRGWSAIVCASLLSSPALLRTTTPAHVNRQIVTRIVIFVGVASPLILSPALMGFPWNGLREAFLFVLILPSAITTAFPFSMALAVDAIRRHEPMSPAVERAAALKLALCAPAFMCLFGGWAMPAANQAWRVQTIQSGILESTYPAARPTRGVRELTTSELVFHPSLAAEHEAFSGGADRATRVRRELNKRGVLIVLPILLVWLRWRAFDLPRRRWVRPLPALASSIVSIVAFFGLYFLGWRIELEWQLAAGIGFWLSIALLAVWGFAAPYFRRQLVALA